MATRRAAWGLMVAIGCGGADGLNMAVPPGAPDGPMIGVSAVCADRVGNYRVTFKQRSGTCGSPGEAVVNLSAGGTDKCTRRPTDHGDSCRVPSDATCPVDGQPGFTVTTRGTITWSTDGRRGSGIVSMEIADSGMLVCSSTYDLTYTKL